MEKIEIRVERQQGVPVGRHWHAIFGVAGGTIGRGGQNKLVLPDADAGVARVHAMVRLESEGAFIANLCERRSILVGDQELRSGQEQRLPLGASIVIGPFTLRAVAPGTPVPEFPASELRPAEAPSSALPNPAPASAASRTAPVASRPSEPTPALAAAPAADLSNPFAFLGTPRDSAASAGVPEPAAGPVRSAAADAAMPLPNPMADAAASSQAPTGKPAPARPLIIPADFDTFAPRAATAVSAGRAPWTDAGGPGLADSLAEVTGVREDGLLRSLPQLKELSQRLDNPAHSGLPETLERGVELDPLRLFSSAIEGRPAPQGLTTGASGDQLGQVFTLPRRAEGPAPQQSAESARAQAQAAGAELQAAQGLDLALFGETPPAERSLYKLTGTVELVPQEPQPRPLPEVPQAPARLPVGLAQLDLELPLGAASAPVGATPVVTPPHAPATIAAQAPGTTASAGATGLDENALIAAFLEGAGLAPGRVEMRLTPEFMRQFGEAFKVAIQGTIDLISARSEIKREFRADVTMIASGANNPLKFLPTAEGVIMQLAGRNFPGFMPPVPAMKEAYRDLQVHQLALMAGIRAAYSEALTRFDPVELEKQFPASGSLIGRWSVSRRKAGLWDGYRQSYLDIRRHAEDDLTAFSGRTFVQAYEAAAAAAGLAP